MRGKRGVGERSRPNPQTAVCAAQFWTHSHPTSSPDQESWWLSRRLATSPFLGPFWTGNHGDVGHAVMSGRERERGDLWLVVESEHCRLLEEGAAAEHHKLSLYLGHRDAPAATSRQDAIMQEEGWGKLWAHGADRYRGRLFSERGRHMSGGCMAIQHETSWALLCKLSCPRTWCCFGAGIYSINTNTLVHVVYHYINKIKLICRWNLLY